MIFLCLCNSTLKLRWYRHSYPEPRDLRIYSPQALRSALSILKDLDMASHPAVPGGKMEPSRKRRGSMRWRSPLYSTTPRENSSVYCQSICRYVRGSYPLGDIGCSSYCPLGFRIPSLQATFGCISTPAILDAPYPGRCDICVCGVKGAATGGS